MQYLHIPFKIWKYSIFTLSYVIPSYSLQNMLVFNLLEVATKNTNNARSKPPTTPKIMGTFFDSVVRFNGKRNNDEPQQLVFHVVFPARLIIHSSYFSDALSWFSILSYRVSLNTGFLTPPFNMQVDNGPSRLQVRESLAINVLLVIDAYIVNVSGMIIHKSLKFHQRLAVVCPPLFPLCL